MNLHQVTSGFLDFLTIAAAVVTTIFWIVVGWRAMRAHEDLADAVRTLAERNPQ